MRKLMKGSGVLMIFFLLGAQFVRPAKTNPPVDPSRTIKALTHIPSEVTAILERSCGDCHSHHTHWPWYSNVAPVSWFVIDHVDHGRKHLNLSTWSMPSPHRMGKSTDQLLENICQEVAQNKMPLASYRLLHPSARLSPQDVRAICEWTRSEREWPSVPRAGRFSKDSSSPNASQEFQKTLRR